MGIAARDDQFSYIPKRISFGKPRMQGFTPKKAVLSVFTEDQVKVVEEAIAHDDLTQLTPQERLLATLLGHRPTTADLEEYYLEDLNPTTIPIPNRQTAPREEPLHETNDLPRSDWSRMLTWPIELLGRGTMLFMLQCYRLFLGQSNQAPLPEEMNKPIGAQENGHLSDMMISTIAGVLIATLIVFPTLRLLGHEVYTTIAKSTVRRIGSKVTLDQSQDSSILLPLVTEQFLFPHGVVDTSSESVPEGGIPSEFPSIPEE